MTLTATLMVALIGVLRELLKERTHAERELFSSLAAAQVRIDLSNATVYRIVNGNLEIAGPLALDPTDRVPLWTEASVRYRVKPTTQGGVLIREQTVSNGGVSRVTKDLIWLGISRVEFITTFLGSQPESQIAALTDGISSDGLVGIQQPVPLGWSRLPAEFQVRFLDSSNRVCFSESVVGLNYD